MYAVPIDRRYSLCTANWTYNNDPNHCSRLTTSLGTRGAPRNIEAYLAQPNSDTSVQSSRLNLRENPHEMLELTGRHRLAAALQWADRPALAVLSTHSLFQMAVLHAAAVVTHCQQGCQQGGIADLAAGQVTPGGDAAR